MSDPASRKDRALRKFSAVLTRAIFRRVDVYRADQTTSEPGPLMSTSNHFGGFLDPLLMMYALPRRPRFLATDDIWKVPIAKQIMNWLGAIPVHHADNKRPGSNDQMFASCYQALADGQHLLIFPEGITRDEPSIGEVKTGTARIVLGARCRGTSDVSIVPIGIHYEDKAAFRSRVSVVVSDPIDVDREIGRYVADGDDPSPENRAAVRALTQDIDVRLREAAPDFANWQEATSLTRASEYTLRALGVPGEPVSLSQRDRLAGLLGYTSDQVKSDIAQKLTDYDRELDALALSDQDVNQPLPGRFWQDLMVRIILGLILLPYAIVGFFVNLIPFMIVKAIGLLPFRPGQMASGRPIAAILLFSATWIIGAVLMGSAFGLSWGWATLAVLPLYGIATVVLWERVVLARLAVKSRRGKRLGRSAHEILLQRRRDLVNAVLEAV